MATNVTKRANELDGKPYCDKPAYNRRKNWRWGLRRSLKGKTKGQ